MNQRSMIKWCLAFYVGPVVGCAAGTIGDDSGGSWLPQPEGSASDNGTGGGDGPVGTSTTPGDSETGDGDSSAGDTGGDSATSPSGTDTSGGSSTGDGDESSTGDDEGSSTGDDGSSTGDDDGSSTGDGDGSSTGDGDTSTGDGGESCDAAVQFGFEDCPSGWEAGEASGQSQGNTWACGRPTSGPGGEIDVWATNLGGTYVSLESSYVRSPALSLAHCEGETITARFRHWYAFEGQYQNWNLDGGVVEVSDDGGTSWTYVEPTAEGYYAGQVLTTGSGPTNGRHGFSGLEHNETWRTSTLDLSPWAGEADVRVRFVFGASTELHLDGWYIDSFAVSID